VCYGGLLVEYVAKWRCKRKEVEDNLAFIQNGGLKDGDLSEFRALAGKILETGEWLCSGDSEGSNDSGDLAILGSHVPIWSGQAVLISCILKYDSQIEDMIAIKEGKQAVVSSMDQLTLLLETKTEFYGDCKILLLLTL
jgi:hypothetical protein